LPICSFGDNLYIKYCIIALLTIVDFCIADISKEKSTYLSFPPSVFFYRPSSFVITESGSCLILDEKGGDIKIFNKEGVYQKTFGRKGSGPNEFIRPYSSAYDNGILLIGDIGRKQIYYYTLSASDFLAYGGRLVESAIPRNMHILKNGTWLMSGGSKVISNELEYSLYIYDPVNRKYEYCLPVHKSLGFNSDIEYCNFRDTQLHFLGMRQFCDSSGANIYTAFSSVLKIACYNIKSKGLTFFGKETVNYIKPKVTRELMQAFNSKNHMLWQDISAPLMNLCGVSG